MPLAPGRTLAHDTVLDPLGAGGEAPARPLVATRRQECDPQVSPDGRLLVFASVADGGESARIVVVEHRDTEREAASR